MDDFRTEAHAVLNQHKDNMDAAAARAGGLEKDLARFRYAADNYNMITGELMRLQHDFDHDGAEMSRVVNQVLRSFVEHAKQG